MEKLEEEQDEVVIIQNRDEKVKDLLHDLLSGAKSLSYSSLKNFAESPEMFIQYCLQERKQTDAMLFGTIVHCLVLEPMEFDKRYFVLDDAQIVSEIGGGNPRLTKVYKEWKALQIENNRGKEMVKPDIYRQAEAIANNVKNNRIFGYKTPGGSADKRNACIAVRWKRFIRPQRKFRTRCIDLGQRNCVCCIIQ